MTYFDESQPPLSQSAGRLFIQNLLILNVLCDHMANSRAEAAKDLNCSKQRNAKSIMNTRDLWTTSITTQNLAIIYCNIRTPKPLRCSAKAWSPQSGIRIKWVEEWVELPSSSTSIMSYENYEPHMTKKSAQWLEPWIYSKHIWNEKMAPIHMIVILIIGKGNYSTRSCWCGFPSWGQFQTRPTLTPRSPMLLGTFSVSCLVLWWRSSFQCK